MRKTEDIFNITPENLTDLIMERYNFIKSGEDLLADLDRYTEYRITDEKTLEEHPFLAEMIKNDRHGEKIGWLYRFELDNPNGNQKKAVSFFFDKDKLIAVKKAFNAEGSDRIFSTERFEYGENMRYGQNTDKVIDKRISGGFAYYRYNPDGNVAEILRVNCQFGDPKQGGVMALGIPMMPKVIHTVFDGSAVANKISEFMYELHLAGGQERYRIIKQYDLLHPVEIKPVGKRVIDNQKRLCKALSKKVGPKSTMEQAVNAFFDTISTAKPNEEEMLLYEVGFFDSDNTVCTINLVRQTPTKFDEFYQMHIKLHYKLIEKDTSLREAMWHESGDNDLKEYIMNSKAYNLFKDQVPEKFDVWVGET